MDRIDEICDSFEDKLKGGNRPEISTILKDLQETERPDVFYELLRLELYYAAEHLPNARSYFDKFPEYSDQIVAAFANTNSGEAEERTVLDLEPLAAEIGSGQAPKIDNYRLIRKLGSGGFADVYLGLDKVSKRAVAIKLLKAGMSDPKIADSFVSEGKILQSLSHPSIPRIISIGKDDNGNPFVVMEFMKGQSFASIVKDGSLDIRPKLEVLAELAKILDDVHQNGFFHRDIKPSNIVVGLDGDPNLVDFGLAVDAKVRSQGEVEFAGTVSYMSPEQASGNPSKAPTDIWALGVILYQLLSGQLPFQGESPAKVIRQITDHDFEPPGKITGNSSNEELERICLKALSFKPEQRHTTALEFSRELSVAASNLRYEKVARTAFSGKESGVDQRLSLQAKAYSVRPERRQLPNFIAYLDYLFRSDRKLWTDKDRDMMQHAGRLHLTWVASLSILMATAIPWVYQTARNRVDESHVDSTLERLGDAQLEEVESLITDLHRFECAADKLRIKLKEAVVAEDESLELRCRMALQKFEPSQTDYLLGQLTNATLDQVSGLQDIVLSPAVLGNVDLSDKLNEIIESYPTVDGVENLWPVMPGNLAREIQANGGMVEEAFAFTPLIELERYLEICELLRESKYRPINARPFESDGKVCVSAVWHRGTRNWTTEIVDTRPASDSRRTENFSAHFHCIEQIPGREDYLTISSTNNSNELESRYFLSVAYEFHPDYFTDVFGLTDIFIEEAHSVAPISERYQQQADLANLILEAKPWRDKADKSAKGDALFLLGRALFYLGDYSDSKTVLSEVISNYPHLLTFSLSLRAQANAHLQLPVRAKSDRDKLAKLYEKRKANVDWTKAFFAGLDCKLESFGGSPEEAIGRLEQWLEGNQRADAYLFSASCYSAVASNADDSQFRQKCIDRGLKLIGLAIEKGLSSRRIIATADLDTLRLDPRFQNFNVSPLGYRGKWNLNDKDTAVKFAKASNFEKHRSTVRAFSMAGYVPISTSVSSKAEFPVVASVWHKTKWTKQCGTHLTEVANAACARLKHEDWNEFWELLRIEADCSLRTQLIHTIPRFEIRLSTLLTRLEEEQDAGVRQAILLAIGSYPDGSIQTYSEQISSLADKFFVHEDSGLHSAAKWLISRTSSPYERAIEAAGGQKERKWELNSTGQTMIRITGLKDFIAGSADNESGRGQLETLKRQRINYDFWISANEVCEESYESFGLKLTSISRSRKTITWFDAAAYCNSLSEREGILESEWCYEFMDDGRVKVRRGKRGYRLPTLNEWRYVCRTRTNSAWFFGNEPQLLGSFGVVFDGDEIRRIRDIEFMPNQLGCFGMCGGVGEWTHPSELEVDSSTIIPTCGGSRRAWLVSSRSSAIMAFPAGKKTSLGLRPTRTIFPSSN